MSINTNRPLILYKYKSLENFDWVAQILNGQLYFNTPNEFNDPIDSMVPFNYDLNENELRFFLQSSRAPEEKIQQALNDIPGALNKLKSLDPLKLAKLTISESYCVCSLTTSNNNWLMWSHYANGHRGVVIGFNTDKFFSDKLIGKVEYKAFIPKVKISEPYMTRMKHSVLTKPSEYMYENEYRVIFHTEPHGKKHFDVNTISEIILGCKISKEHEKKLIQLLNSLSITPKIFKCILPQSGQKFNLTLEELSL